MLSGELGGPLLTTGRSVELGSPKDLEEGRGRGFSVDELQRYQTGIGAPWEHEDWSPEKMEEYLHQEHQAAKAFFQAVIGPDTVIPRSPLSRPPAALTFKDVSFTAVKADGSRQPILAPCSGHFSPGQLVAIMGPSGCGKSTLLDMLAMKKTASYDGTILLNGRPRDHLFQRVAAYVGQEDVMPQHWTVREAVQFNLALKNNAPGAVTSAIKESAVDLLLCAFGLSSVAETFIGGPKVRGISGGQRRRVTLARGVAARSSLLFCDEPTSGLSATDAELCVRALRIIGKKMNMTILVVIHQPRVEVAELFDRLVLLTSGPGRMVYDGPMAKALDYFAECGHPVPQYANPTDIYLDLVTPGGPKDTSDLFAQHYQERQKPGIDTDVAKHMQPEAVGRTVVEMLQSHHQAQERAGLHPPRLRTSDMAVPFMKQVAILFRRKVALVRRNPSAIRMPIVVPVLVGCLMGLMFQGIGDKPFGQRLSFVFMLLTRICLGGMQLMPNLIEERMIMKYDTSETLYSVEAFIIVGFAVDITISLIGALLNVLIMYAFGGMAWKYFGLIIEWAVLNFFVFDSFFGFLAAVSPSLQTAQVAAIPFNSIFMMFSGFMISKASAPAYFRWIFTISPIGYAVQSIFVTMAKDDPEGPFIVKMYGFEDGQDARGISVMIIMVVVLRLLQVWALKYKNNIQK